VRVTGEGTFTIPDRVPVTAAPPTPARLKSEPLVGMPPIRALGITDAGATLPSRDEREGG
jgi:hypothetical protein